MRPKITLDKKATEVFGNIFNVFADAMETKEKMQNPAPECSECSVEHGSFECRELCYIWRERG